MKFHPSDFPESREAKAHRKKLLTRKGRFQKSYEITPLQRLKIDILDAVPARWTIKRDILIRFPQSRRLNKAAHELEKEGLVERAFAKDLGTDVHALTLYWRKK